ncbi:tyrosine-type recombinase/integrase [Pleomorphomonas sp. NRK KF1]|uniref:tyrosine-type recombinase/integrase n=1 Tax=Pleomorphomonas sp. NRK KF1 TaxID=2943000 RepID=UPI00204462EB|nr:tyrosine-type recombinase/integrase [Pleomorphomonas sp. NRK KF1]
MVRVKLKGINSKTKKLADGSFKTYWYAWKGGPRLEGVPGSAEFVASYNAAVSQKRQAPAGTLLSIMNGFQASPEFTELAERTRKDYVKHILKIEKEFGDFPTSALPDRRTRAILLGWRDELAQKSRRQADYTWSILARMLSWAEGRGLIAVNPCSKAGRLYRADRNDKVWTDDDEAMFLKHAPAHLHLPLMLALWTGQRQGDLLRLPWTAYDGEKIRLRQSKTGVRVVIPVATALKAMLDPIRKREPSPILVNSYGSPWTPAGFQTAWARACEKAGIEGLTFHDLRGTAVTRLAKAECTEAEIATLTGHSLRDVRSILDSHYLSRDPTLAESAIRKLEARTKFPDQTPDRAGTFHEPNGKSVVK